jgi:hypothetical protein
MEVPDRRPGQTRLKKTPGRIKVLRLESRVFRNSDSLLEDLGWTRTRARVRDSDSKVGDSITRLLSNINCRLRKGKLGITVGRQALATQSIMLTDWRDLIPILITLQVTP